MEGLAGSPRSTYSPSSERLRRVPSTYRTELRLYTARAHRYPTRVRPTHQATARTALLPIGVPSSSPRSVSMTGVKGWYSANQRIPIGIESGRTNALLVNGSSALEDEGEAIRSRGRFAYHAEHYSHPRDCEGEQRNDAERLDPAHKTCGGPETYK